VVGTDRVKRGMAEMLKGGVIMDVVTPEQARIAEDAGAVAVMALERVPADIRAQGGVSRMSDPDMIDSIIETVSIPVMAKARIGHFVEAQILDHRAHGAVEHENALARGLSQRGARRLAVGHLETRHHAALSVR
jgi:pyridoxal 5'-phosphate synthase pdxS subunit